MSLNQIFTSYEVDIIESGKAAYILDTTRSVGIFAAEAAVTLRLPFVSGIKYLSFVLPILKMVGLIFTAIETGYEIFSLYQTYKFHKILSPKTTLEKLENLHKEFFELNAEDLKKVEYFSEKLKVGQEGLKQLVLVGKKEKLQRRISERATLTVETRLESLIEKLKQQNVQPSVSQEADELIETLKTQNIKQLLIHGFGLTSIAFPILAITLIFTAVFPPAGAAIFGILAIGTVLGIASYLLEHGSFTQEGWRFSFKACLPTFSVCKSGPPERLL